jgi:alanine dehydrogenase
MKHQNFPHSWALGKGSLLPQEEVLERGLKRKQLVVGIPRELQEDESRTTLTPEAVEMLVDNGHHIIIETGVGTRANYSDNDYSECGGFIVDNHAEIFSKSDIILKISPPVTKEIESMKRNQVIISSLRHMTQIKIFFTGL